MKGNLKKMGRGLRLLLRTLPWKKIVIVAAGTLCYYLLARFAQFRLPAFGLTFRPQLALAAFWGVVWGPFAGLLAPLLAELWAGLAAGSLFWSVVAASGLCGFGAGLFCNGRYRRAGGFTGGGILPFLFGGLLAQAVAWVVVCPALDLLFYREALENLLRRGLLDAVSNTLACWVAGTLLLALFGNIVPGRPKPPPPCEPDGQDYGEFFPAPRQPANLFDEGGL